MIKVESKWIKDFLDDLIKNGRKGFFSTGSVYFDLDNENSDIDFVVKREDWNAINKESVRFYGKRINPISMNDDGFPKEYEFENIKFEYKDKIYNFIVVPDIIEFKIWKQVTDSFVLLMKSRIMKRVLRNKSYRVELFELLKRFLREYYMKED